MSRAARHKGKTAKLAQSVARGADLQSARPTQARRPLGEDAPPESETTVFDDVVLLRELLAYFGWREAARLIGTCFLLGLQGKNGKIVDTEGPEYTTQWRARRELLKFGKYLQARGIVLADHSEDGLQRRLAQLRGPELSSFLRDQHRDADA